MQNVSNISSSEGISIGGSRMRKRRTKRYKKRKNMFNKTRYRI